MTSTITGQWVSQAGGAPAPSARRWESLEIAPRVATSTANPAKALVFSVVLAVATATTPAGGGDISLRLISSAGISPYDVVTGAWTEIDASHPDITDEAVPHFIEELRSEYKLSDSSIAEIFNVSRQTVYNWRTGKTATGFPERVWALTDALRQVRSEDVPYLQRVLFYPTSDGRLIQDTLSDNAWTQDGAAGVDGVVAELIGKAQQLRDRDLKTIARLEKSGGSHSV